MIKFFRKIRQKLLSENKFCKYLLYAFGEIVLVVIGILIALQINNWNEEKKNQIVVSNILQDLLSDLKKDSIDIAHHIKYSEQELNKHNSVMERSRNKEATLDTLVNLGKNEFQPHWVAPLNYNSTTFQSIKSSGKLELLPDPIKKEISVLYSKIGYYEYNLNEFNTQYKASLNDFSQHFILNIGSKSDYLARKISWKDIDKKEFAIKFDRLLTFRSGLWNYYYESLKKQEKRIHTVIKMVKNELQLNE